MKNTITHTIAVCAGLLTGIVSSQVIPSSKITDSRTILPYFSPKGGCTAIIVQQINEAKKSIYIQAYSFTSLPIMQSIASAALRGLDIQIIIDKESSENTSKVALDYFTKAKIPLWLDKKHSIAHNKIIIIDESIVITGSFNFTAQAENSNAENLLIINDFILAKTYLQNFKLHQGHSIPVP